MDFSKITLLDIIIAAVKNAAERSRAAPTVIAQTNAVIPSETTEINRNANSIGQPILPYQKICLIR